MNEFERQRQQRDKRRNGSPLVVPGQVQLAMGYHPGPLVQPVHLTTNTPNGVQTHVWGGTTRMQEATLAIFCAMVQCRDPDSRSYVDNGETIEETAERAAKAARCVIDAAMRHDPFFVQQEPPPAEQEPESPIVEP